MVLVGVIVFFIHFNNTKHTSPVVNGYYYDLKQLLKEKGYSNNLIVISTKRSKLENYFFENFSVAATDSHHLTGQALDLLVGDINNDKKVNSEDVEIVIKVLDTEIVIDKGGVGTYKNKGWLTRQMVHIDCRGKKIRWNY